MISTPDCCQDYTSVEAVEREVLGSKWWIVGLMDRDFILLSAFPQPDFLAHCYCQSLALLWDPKKKDPLPTLCL